MSHIFEFGISQDDALTENRALDLRTGDRLLCVASAGEVPLNLLALADIKVYAVDISINQLFLSKLKLKAVLALDPLEAASLLGFMDADSDIRLKYFDKVNQLMDEDEKSFWQKNIFAIQNGPVHESRFEKYISRFGKIGLRILGRKRMMGLLECESPEQHKDYFDRYLSTFLIKSIFRIAFHPKIYKNRGLSEEGLKHRGQVNMASFFYGRFRDFCTSTVARRNYYLQFTFFNKILFQEALPEYLKDDGLINLRKNFSNISFGHLSYNQALTESSTGEFNKFALSNICDWMDKDEFTETLMLIKEKVNNSGRILSRYIHFDYPVRDGLEKYFKTDYDLGEALIHQDRYPFYSLVPMIFNKEGSSQK